MLDNERVALWERLAIEVIAGGADLEGLSARLAQAVLALAKDRRAWEKYTDMRPAK